MATCRFCKSEISSDATRCPHCTSFLSPEGDQESSGKVTYIVDRGIITFLKIAGPTFAFFIIVGLSFYSLDFYHMTQTIHDTQTKMNDTYTKVNETYANSKRVEVDISRAQLDLETKRAAIAANVALAQKSAQDAKSSLEKILASEQKASAGTIKIRGFVAEIERLPRGQGLDPSQMERLVEAKLLASLKDVLPTDQYAKLQVGLVATGPRRLVFTAKNNSTLPGSLARSEGGPPVKDTLINQIYDDLQKVHDFYKEVFGREIADDMGGSLVITVQYEKDFNNAFWNGQQLVFGDADGKVFKKGAFYKSSVMVFELAHAVIEKTSKLKYEHQSGGLNYSFSDVASVLFDQWVKKQRVEEANWLVLPDGPTPTAAAKLSVNALRSVKESKVGLAPQISTMAEYRDGLDAHYTAGIPNKAFYEFAIRLRGNAWEKPGRVWYEAVIGLKEDSTFQDFADATFAVAKSRYGEQSPESKAVTQSWAVVGITTPRQQN